ncbi:post-GPI attachment to proteins factor 6 [Galleria mellonella]|uniref:Post-GPI attachment to proteins factor 6 n=1 Tax=Galleria mellonella TaxID=7137 RepID=A0A6J1WWU0_GALME|nr:post-GPI attachment to proteins factor 6 [Galleria mellonella]
MKASLCFLLVYVYVCSAASNSDKEIEEDRNRKRIIEQLTRTRTVLHEDYQLVTRQIATDVYMFRSYRTVSVVFYPIMRQVSDARFTFQSEELHLNNIGSCDPQEIVVNIKYGAYAAVNPDGYDFPKDFVDPATREDLYTLELESDGRNRTYSIKNPKPGQWYALIYIKWEDPRTQALEQQGLVADCQTIIYTDLQVKRVKDIEYVNCYSGLTVNYTQIPSYYKCMSRDKVQPIRFNLTVNNAPIGSKKVLLKIQTLSLPTDESHILSCAFDPNSGTQSVVFIPNLFEWHYLYLDFIDNSTNIADCESYITNDDHETDNYTILELMRDDRGRFFTFDYGLPTTDLQDTTSLVNISSNEIKTLRFKVHQFLDIGGSLSIEASLLMSLKYYMGYKRELKEGALLAFTEENQYFKAVICLDIGYSSIPLENGYCKYNDHIKPALFILNSTDSDSIYDKVIIPFPESGTWYLTFRIFCDDVVCPCRTTDNGTKYYVDSTPLDKDAIQDSTTKEVWREGTSECNATVVLSVSSTSCVAGKCSNHGNCLLNTFGGLVMSFCSCSAGYGGWDCSDDSRMDSKLYMLVSVLLLTLSNLLFSLSIYIAIIRLYYTEAMMYGFTMIFSTFYHACDAPAQVAYCILTGNILQFGDFYCGIMSFWVTLLAMSIINERFRSSLQLIGAIVIALLTTWNRRSFMAFVLPVAVGLFILLLSWYLDYRKYRKMKFPRSYYKIYLLLGLVSVSIGLICYGFLQTEQNYKVVHSIWHMIVAVSVVFLLPDNKRGDDSNPFLPSPDYCRLPSCNFFRRTQTPIATD